MRLSSCCVPLYVVEMCNPFVQKCVRASKFKHICFLENQSLAKCNILFQKWQCSMVLFSPTVSKRTCSGNDILVQALCQKPYGIVS